MGMKSLRGWVNGYEWLKLLVEDLGWQIGSMKIGNRDVWNKVVGWEGWRWCGGISW